jgi:hypothetical protein
MVRVFRPQPFLGVAMAVAAAFWLAVLVFLVQNPVVPAKTFLSTGFFVILFVLSVAYYARTAILVDTEGLIYRGMVKEVRLKFDEIQRLAVIPGLITLYTVHAGGRTFSFSSFFQRHKELVALLRERAELR